MMILPHINPLNRLFCFRMLRSSQQMWRISDKMASLVQKQLTEVSFQSSLYLVPCHHPHHPPLHPPSLCLSPPLSSPSSLCFFKRQSSCEYKSSDHLAKKFGEQLTHTGTNEVEQCCWTTTMYIKNTMATDILDTDVGNIEQITSSVIILT